MHSACQFARIPSKLQMAVLPGLVSHQLPPEIDGLVDVAKAELNRVDLPQHQHQISRINTPLDKSSM